MVLEELQLKKIRDFQIKKYLFILNLGSREQAVRVVDRYSNLVGLQKNIFCESKTLLYQKLR